MSLVNVYMLHTLSRSVVFFSDILSATNIIFSNGDLDPWSVGGVSNTHVVHTLTITTHILASNTWHCCLGQCQHET